MVIGLLLGSVVLMVHHTYLFSDLFYGVLMGLALGLMLSGMIRVIY